MSAGTKRVSIIVATKDRYETLFYCVRGLLINYGGDDCEIVVRDNSVQPRADEFRAAFGACPSVVYHADPTPVSQQQAFRMWHQVLWIPSFRNDKHPLLGMDVVQHHQVDQLITLDDQDSLDSVIVDVAFTPFGWRLMKGGLLDHHVDRFSGSEPAIDHAQKRLERKHMRRPKHRPNHQGGKHHGQSHGDASILAPHHDRNHQGNDRPNDRRCLRFFLSSAIGSIKLILREVGNTVLAGRSNSCQEASIGHSPS